MAPRLRPIRHFDGETSVDVVGARDGLSLLVGAERFAAADPYVKNGLVARWEVRRWITVVGPYAAQPV